MKRLTYALLSLALVVITAFGFTACKEKSVSNCSTGWTVEKFATKDLETGKTEEVSQFVCFYLTLNSKTLNEVWINVGEMKEEEVKLTVNRYNSTTYEDSTSTSYKREVTVSRKQYKESANGWIKLVGDYNSASAYVKLSLTGGMTINEVAFINKEEGKRMSFAVRAAKMVVSDEKGALSSKDYYTASEIEDMKLTDSPLLLGDEQTKFDEK